MARLPGQRERRRPQPHRSGLRQRAGRTDGRDHHTGSDVDPACHDHSGPGLLRCQHGEGRERPFREAVDTSQRFVASGAVWLALALAGVFGILESLDRWGVGTFLALVLGPSVVVGVVWAVVSIRRERRQEAAVPDSLECQSATGGK